MSAAAEPDPVDALLALSRKLSPDDFSRYCASLAVDKARCPTSFHDDMLRSLYLPDPRLAGEIQKLTDYRAIKKPLPAQRKEAGLVMERVAGLAFRGLQAPHPKVWLDSYTAAVGQYDLLCTVTCPTFQRTLWRYIGLAEDHRCRMLVEAKATASQVDVAIMGRMCALLDAAPIGEQVALGVFFTLVGATGHERGDGASRRLSDARLLQALFYAAKKRPVIVLDYNDICTLTQPGSLPLLLRAKILDCGDHQGGQRWTLPGHRPKVPKHLEDLVGSHPATLTKTP